MKAMVLAAGRGTRLKPFTDNMPKPMIPVAGRPILEHIVIQLRDVGFTDLVINLHYHPEAITEHFGNGDKFGVRIHYSRETALLGTAGAVKKIQDQFIGPFLVYYGDNYVEIDLDQFVRAHHDAAPVATIAVFPCDNPSMSGIARVDDGQNIVEFVEKPVPGSNAGNLANAGVYILNPGVLKAIPADRPSDFGHDIFPELLRQGQNLKAFMLSGRVIGVDTPELHTRLERYLSGRKRHA